MKKRKPYAKISPDDYKKFRTAQWIAEKKRLDAEFDARPVPWFPGPDGK